MTRSTSPGVQPGAGEGIVIGVRVNAHLRDVLGRECSARPVSTSTVASGWRIDPGVDDDPLPRRDRFGRQEATDEHPGDRRGVIGR